MPNETEVGAVGFQTMEKEELLATSSPITRILQELSHSHSVNL